MSGSCLEKANEESGFRKVPRAALRCNCRTVAQGYWRTTAVVRFQGSDAIAGAPQRRVWLIRSTYRSYASL